MFGNFKVIGGGRVRTSEGAALFSDGNRVFDNEALGGKWLRLAKGMTWSLVATYAKTDTHMIAFQRDAIGPAVGVVLRQLSFETLLEASEEVLDSEDDKTQLTAWRDVIDVVSALQDHPSLDVIGDQSDEGESEIEEESSATT